MLVNNAKNIDDLRTLATHFSGTISGYFIAKNLLILKTIIERRELAADAYEQKRHDAQVLYHDMESSIDLILDMQESYLPFFLTVAAVGPLLGLFGTVWGLIHSFVRISQYQSADIIAVAPGIAEALITTLMGLVVTIPALIMYNYFLTQIRTMEKLLLYIVEKMRAILMPLVTR